MAIRDILVAPDPRLRQVSTAVETVDDNIRALMDDMKETMYAADGVGLTAIQINVPKRIVVMDIAHDKPEPEPHFFINPEILDPSQTMMARKEGCLSVPGFFEEVERPASCRVRYLNHEGIPKEMKCEGLMSICIQHEVEHLNGVLFVDHISRLKRQMILKRLAKEKRHGDPHYGGVMRHGGRAAAI